MNFFDIIQHGIILWDSTPLVILGVLVSIIIPYLLGSLNFAIIISAKQYNQDIRSFGSKNAGMTNMMRTYGKKAAGLTLIGDALKAIVACAVGYLMLGYIGCYIAGLFCVIGHMFPVFYKFKGGKGVVTGAMAILMGDPITFAIILLIFIIIVAFTRYISLGSIMSVLLYPIILDRVYKWVYHDICPFIIFAILLAVLVVAKHYENIKRLMQGKENKFSFKKSKPVAEAEVSAPVSENEAEISDDNTNASKATKKKKINKNYGKKKK